MRCRRPSPPTAEHSSDQQAAHRMHAVHKRSLRLFSTSFESNFFDFFKSFRYVVVWLYSKTASHFQNIRSRLYYSRMLMVASKKDVWISEYELLLLGHFEQIVHPLKIFARRRYQPLHVVCARCGVVVRARFPSRPAFSLQICACSSIPHAARGSFFVTK